jgi:transposase-like protein
MAESAPQRPRWTQARKTAVVLELLRGGDAMELARTYGLSQAELFSWRARFLAAGQAALQTRRPRAELEQEQRVRALERKGGQLTLENEVLTKTDALIRQHGRRLNT